MGERTYVVDLFFCQQYSRAPGFPGSRCPTTPVRKRLRIGRWVELQHNVNVGKVESPGSNIRS